MKKIFLTLMFFLVIYAPLSAAHNNTHQQTSWFKWPAIIATCIAAGWTAYSYMTLSQELVTLKNKDIAHSQQIAAFTRKERENQLTQNRIHAANEQLRLAMENVAHAPEDSSMQRTTQALQAGANANSRFRSRLGQFSMPALWFAVDAGKLQVVQALINARADVNAAIDPRALANYQPDRFITDSNFFGASPLLFWAIQKENEATQNHVNEADSYFYVTQLLINNGAYCPPDLPVYLRPSLPETNQQNNAGPNYVLTHYSAISDKMHNFLIERQPKPMQERHALLYAAPPSVVFPHNAPAKSSWKFLGSREPQN